MNGYLHGLVRIYIDEIDDETNMAKSEKHLSKIQLMNSGQIEGNSWTFPLNGMKIFEKDSSSHEVILFVPSINET